MKYLLVFDRQKELEGQYGDLLWNLLLKVGILKEECAFKNVNEEINEEAQVIIAFGKESCKRFTGFSDLESRRGSVYEQDGRIIIPTFSPSEAARGGGTSHWYLPALLCDLKRAKDIAEKGLRAQHPTVDISSDPTVVDQYLSGCASRNSLVAFDIETALYGGERIRCIGFAASPERALVVPTENIPVDQYYQLLAVLEKWMSGSQIRWVGQNGYGFDINYIQTQWKFLVQNYVADTMVMHHLLAPEFPHDLGTITSFYTTIPYYKDTSDKDLHRYNGLDAVATYISAVKMQEELHKRGLLELYRTYYHKLLTPLREMSARGVRIDVEYQKELRDELKKEIEQIQEELDKEYAKYSNTNHLERRLNRTLLLRDDGRKTILLRGKRKRLSSMVGELQKRITRLRTLNVRSTKEMQGFLYGTLKLKAVKKKGKVTTDELALNKLFIQTGHPFLKLMIKLRQVRKSMSDYGMMKVDKDNRVRTVYKFVETGRLSSGRFNAK